MRARMALYDAGIACEVREVELKHKPVELLRISPKATVPVLQLPDGRVLDESLDIMLWALSEHDPHGYLSPDAADLDAMLALIHDHDGCFKYHLDRYKYPQHFEPDGIDHFAQASRFLAALEQRLQDGRYLFGESPALADIALFPFVRQFAAVDRQLFEQLPMPGLQHWLSGWLGERSFLQIMCKRPPWQQGMAPGWL